MMKLRSIGHRAANPTTDDSLNEETHVLQDDQHSPSYHMESHSRASDAHHFIQQASRDDFYYNGEERSYHQAFVNATDSQTLENYHTESSVDLQSPMPVTRRSGRKTVQVTPSQERLSPVGKVPQEAAIDAEITEAHSDPDGDESDNDEASVLESDDSSSEADKRGERKLAKPFSKKNLKRHRLTHSETRFLLNQFGQNPHPDAAQRAQLSKKITNLSARQIQVWFQNRRAKLKRMSAADADRMLSTRSYPEGYGPKGFENAVPETKATPYEQAIDSVYSRRDYKEAGQPPASATFAREPRYLHPESKFGNLLSSGPISSAYLGNYSKGCVRTKESRIRDDSYETAQESPLSSYADSPGLNQNTPLPGYGFASPHSSIYSPYARSPAVHTNAFAGYARSSSQLYAPRSIPNEADYIAALQRSTALQAAFATSPTDARQSKQEVYAPYTTSHGNGGQTDYQYSGQPYHYAKADTSNDYASNASHSRPPLGYSQASSRGFGAEHDTYSDLSDSPMSNVGPSRQAPLMQREVKYGHAAARYANNGTPEDKLDGRALAYSGVESGISAPRLTEYEHNRSHSSLQLHRQAIQTHSQPESYDQHAQRSPKNDHHACEGANSDDGGEEDDQSR